MLERIDEIWLGTRKVLLCQLEKGLLSLSLSFVFKKATCDIVEASECCFKDSVFPLFRERERENG